MGRQDSRSKGARRLRVDAGGVPGSTAQKVKRAEPITVRFTEERRLEVVVAPKQAPVASPAQAGARVKGEAE